MATISPVPTSSHTTLNIKGANPTALCSFAIRTTNVACWGRGRRRRDGGERIYLSTRYIIAAAAAAAMAICHSVAEQWPTRQLEKCTDCHRFRKQIRLSVSLLRAGKTNGSILDKEMTSKQSIIRSLQ